MAWDKRVPFNTNENRMIMSEYHSNLHSPDIEWRSGTFEATMRFARPRGRFLKDVATETEYYMLPSDFSHLLRNSIIDHGIISGLWGYRKHSTEYGIKYLGRNS